MYMQASEILLSEILCSGMLESFAISDLMRLIRYRLIQVGW